jgi:acetyl esterase/lipase
MSDSSPRYDSELQAFLEGNPDIDRSSLAPEGIAPLRQEFVSLGLHGLITGRNLEATESIVRARDGHEFPMTTIRAKGSSSPSAAIFHIHSGGMIAGDRFIGMDLMADWVEKYNLVCASPEYRLSPENPDPTPLNDCYDALLDFAQSLDQETPLIIAGMSAGGGLSAGLSLMSRDLNGPKLAGTLLMCPMLDYRNDSPSSQQFQNLGLWDKGSNDTGWNAYLGDTRFSGTVSPYASPFHAEDLSGLPPTFLDVGALEVFRSEIAGFAEKLAQADVPVEFHMWMGAFHGFDLTYPEAQVSQEAMKARERWLLRLVREVEQ